MADVNAGSSVPAEPARNLSSRSGDRGSANSPKSKAHLRNIWPHIRQHRNVLIVIAVVSLVASGMALVQPLILQGLINNVGTGAAITSALWLLIAVTIGAATFGGIQSYLLRRTAEGVVLGTRKTLVWHLFQLPIVEFDRRRIGDLISRVGADTTLFRQVITSGLFDIVSSVLMFFGAMALMATIDVVLLAITLGAITIGTASVLGLGMAMRRASRRAQDNVGDMTAAIERVLGAIRSVRAAGATERETDLVGAEATNVYRHGVRLAALGAFVQPIMSISIQGAFVVVLGLGGYRVVTGVMEVGDLVAFLLYLLALVMPLGSAIGAFTTVQTGLAALDRMQEVLQLPLETADETTIAGPAPARHSEALLVFDNVGFAYDDGTPVLDGVSFEVARGSRTAVVGPSGAGKSSILALIERFYDPVSGTIVFDGRNVTTMRRADLRRRIAYVEQEAPVLAGSLADNLRLAAPDTSDETLQSALADVGLGTLTERSSEGLAMQVGDGGVLLSGGQRQRLAWARAFLAGADFLLLDEPTSSVDSRTEAALQRALRQIGFDRTVLVVAHRLATVVDSDRIIVLDAGKVVAIGTHRELIDTSPLYHELAENQLLA